MAIQMTNGPAGAREIIANAVTRLFDETDGIINDMITPVDGGERLAVESAAPHPVFMVGLEDVAAGHLLSGAQRLGWRYLLLRDGEAVGTATVRAATDKEMPVFSHVTRGPYVRATVEGINAAAGVEETKDADYELRFLDVPAVHLRAVWLHSANRDLLIPLAPAPGQLEAYRVYSEEELIAAVHYLAGRALERDDGMGG